MLHRLVIENLKGFGPRQEVELAPLTLIYGPNSGGKSTLIQSLLLLKQTVSDSTYERAGLVTQGPLVNLGTFPAALHRQVLDRTMRIGITCSAPEQDYPQFGQPLGGYSEGGRAALGEYEQTLWAPGDRLRVEYGFMWDENREEVLQTEGLLEIEQRSPVCRFTNGDPWGGTLALADAGTREAWNLWMGREWRRKLAWMRDQPPRTPEHDLFLQEFQQGIDGAWALNPWFRGENLFPWLIGGMNSEPNAPDKDEAGADPQFNFTFEAAIGSTWASLANYYGGLFRQRLGEIAHLGPLRRAPERYTTLTGRASGGVGQEGEQTLQRLAGDQYLLGVVNGWLERLQVPYTLAVRRIRDKTFGDLLLVTLTDRRNGVSVSPRDVGFGISQVLPIVVEVLSGASKVCVEQPELHLHPRLQAELADLFLDQVQTDTRKQFLIETHSEALMLRIQRRIREGVLAPDDVSVLYVDPEGGTATTVKRLRLDRLGRFIDEWPGGFFEERLNETLLGFEN